MKNNLKTAIVIATLSLLSCKSQQNSIIKSVVPKIENYTKGELEIRVTPFGADSINEIKVGYISLDGSIHFKWPKIDLETYKASSFFMHSLDFLLGMYNCNEEIIKEKNEVIKAADTKFLLLYNKYGDFVGWLQPANS